MQSFPDAAYYDFSNRHISRAQRPSRKYLRQTLSPQQSLVIVDEIQKLPALLDEIQLLIERNKKLRVILTGSSARNSNGEPPIFSADVPGFAAYIHLCQWSWMAQGYSIVSIAGVSHRSLIPSTTRKTSKLTWGIST